MIRWRAGAGVTLAAWLASLSSGCATRPLLVESLPRGAARRALELGDTPFFPQRVHQCGPAALATVLAASQVKVTPDELEPLVYLPKKQGSLQIEMQATPRKYDRVSYALGSNLDDIVNELNAGRPVLVLHNYGLPLWPRWHYAVVIGYDAAADTVLLRSGTTRRQVLSARNFMRAWDNANRWAMVVLQPGELPTQGARVGYLEAAAAFERVARPDRSRLAFEAASKQWPNEPLAWVGLGTANYRSGRLAEAASDYTQALRIDGSQSGARNNLAMTLLDLGCIEQAREQLGKIDAVALTGPLRDAVLDTRAQIEARAAQLNAESCRLRPAP